MPGSSASPAVVLLSGGLDSAVCLAWARREGKPCHALTIDYGQRHRCELEAAARVAAALGAESHRIVTVDLRAVGGSALTADIPVPKGRTAHQLTADLPSTYVPARNLIFLSIAAGYAQVLGGRDLYYGANRLDYSGYPDCREPFVEAFAEAANLGCGLWLDRGSGAREATGFRVHAPLIARTKAEIIRLGAELSVDFAMTHSCYDPGERGLACGECDSCSLRRRGFEQAGLPDPTRYVGARPEAAKP